jgi:ADP-ribose pyrophosphatase
VTPDPSPPGDLPTPLHSERVYDGRIVTVDRETIRMPNGVEVDLELIRHPGAAAVVALLDPESPDPQVLLIRQYRHAAGGMIWEVPAGVLEDGETPDACARRELEEETGAHAATVEHLTTVFTTPGFTDERIHLFLATGIEPGDARPASDELLTVEARPLSQVLGMIRDGEITDGKSIAALLFVAGFRLGL